MKYKYLVYALLWMAFIAYGYLAFPLLHDKVMFPIGILMALAAWWFSRTTALLMCLSGLIHHIINYQVFADVYDNFQNRLNATLSSLLLVFIFNTLRKHVENIRNLNSRLSHLVKERTQEYEQSIGQLIASTEHAKIINGKFLHDELGQKMTGIHLLCSSLYNHLLDDESPCKSIAADLDVQVAQTHNQLRKIARLLFPMKIEFVGLQAALQEYASSLAEINDVDISVVQSEKIDALDNETALQAYRICQEICVHCLEKLDAQYLRIDLSQSPATLALGVEYGGRTFSFENPDDLIVLIQYRLSKICAKLELQSESPGQHKLSFIIPRKANRA